MTVYFVALVDIADRQEFGVYEQGFMDVFSQYGGRILAVDDSPCMRSMAEIFCSHVIARSRSRQAAFTLATCAFLQPLRPAMFYILNRPVAQ